jgi:tRNA(fMet)-specific endonuclease VapC
MGRMTVLCRHDRDPSAGSAVRTRPGSLAALNAFLNPFEVLAFTSDDARAYADIRARLEKSGKPIGALDMLIAAQAVARGHWLVTDNEREFRRVAGLEIENWSK